mmetsp:Transcript_25030/g.35059  ORF Transcript_25030/g.35059 Transcript_25030/m.35059 type:complete len:308 (+) Transcript_25030:37-960(+)
MSHRTLPAPNLADDFYTNVLDWSKNNIVAIGLSNVLTLLDASGQVTELMKTEPDNNITSVSWMKDGRCVAVGTKDGNIQLWDAEAAKLERNLPGHTGRVGSLTCNEEVLSSGSADTTIRNWDTRVNDAVSVFRGHTQEVCGLKWSEDGSQLASGGNDNLVNIWDAGATSAKFTFTDHKSAVKALAWCPWQKDLLATGGGTCDQTIRFWNTNSGACLNTIDAGSQVSSLMWAKNLKKLISGLGFSNNQLVIWKYPSLAKDAELSGHQGRILHLAMSPDSKTVASAAADETLRFWNVFDVESEVPLSRL